MNGDGVGGWVGMFEGLRITHGNKKCNIKKKDKQIQL
jgi:hypothetical protein